MGEEGALEPIIMLSNLCKIIINIKFATKIHAEADDEELSSWFDHIPEWWKAGSRLYVLNIGLLDPRSLCCHGKRVKTATVNLPESTANY